MTSLEEADTGAYETTYTMQDKYTYNMVLYGVVGGVEPF